MRVRVVAAGCLLLAGWGCASTGSSATGNRNLILQDEIESVPAGTAYQVVQALRPEFLRVRQITTLDPVQDERVVFLNGQRLGGLEELRNIPTSINITSIRFISASEATQRWGPGLRAGAIEVRTQ